MKDFTIYKTDTGIIEYVTSSDCNITDIPIKEDETIVEGNYSPSKYKFVNGKPVEQEITINYNTNDL
ncbi:MAG: hypothetical protein CMC22_00315 [Flavobacteriaceae bacterium]|nr:hypothetical protein [Flavobacteriaceae bacterium]|tara:strand:+ start:2158 stop:2358 length:201 start_codon:yes stop_codon:yes gene_type:complete